MESDFGDDSSGSDSKKPETGAEEGSAIVCSNGGKISNLPEDLVFLILNKLSEHVDHVRFAVVCKHWRSFVEECNHEKKLPMLLMTSRTDRNVLHRVTSAQEKVSVYKSLHDLLLFDNGKKIVGSVHGWLATVKLVDQLLIINLLDPFRKEVAPIRLPLLDYKVNSHNKNPNWRYSYCVSCVKKVIFSADSKFDLENYCAIALYDAESSYPYARLAFIKGGQKNWTYIYKNERFMSNAIFHKNRVYAVGSEASCIMSFDVNNVPQPPEGPRYRRHRDYMEYLVESTKGNLWYVLRFLKFDDHDKFQVSKVVLNDIDGTILQLEWTAGDETLFIGGINNPVSVPASNSHIFQPDSIYYTG